MKNQFRFSVVSAASVLALLLSASAFLLVGAQEPTPTATLEEPSATPSETTESSATPTPEQSSPTTEASATETPTFEFTSTETGTETATLEFSQTPTETVSPTVTPTPQDAPLQISAITSASVIWCPATVAAPAELSMGCTAAYTELADLEAALDAGVEPIVDGTVWIGNTYAGVANVDFNGGTLTVMATHKLTFKGGWSGVGGTITGTPSPVNHLVFVTGWGNEVSLSNLVIDGAAGGDNLSITTSGKITLTNIESTDAPAGESGAVLNNTAGTADVIVTGGAFHTNTGGSGLEVISNGGITLSNVSIHDNGSDGAVLNNDTAAVPKPVSVTNNSAFNSNSGDGLSIITDGNITLSGVTATFNTGYGAYLNHPSGGATTGNFSITSGTFSNNDSDGLNATSNGTITVTNVTASSNTVGAYLINTIASAAKNVTLAGTNVFNSNDFNGLYVITKGAIALNNVTASFNGITGTCCNGAILDNDNGANPGMGVIFTGTNVFSGNYNSGLSIDSYGPVTLNSVTANSNLNGKGTDIENSSATTAQAVTITGTNQFNSNELVGLEITTKGAVMLSNITANTTQAGAGVTVSNLTGSADVTVSVGEISTNIGVGLGVSTNGAVTLSNGSIHDNANDGVQIDNDDAATPKNVTITNTSSSNNTGLGFNVETDGSMVVSGATANGNTSWGAYFHHDVGGPTASNCSFTSSTFNTNGNTNLEVDCNGNITLTNVTANGSTGGDGNGANLDGFFSSAVKNVTLAGANEFNNNWSTGLAVVTKGAIVVNDLTANLNGNAITVGSGANLQNDSGPNPGMGITLTGTNVFSDNYQNGLLLASNGPIKANNVIANSNLNGSGAIIDNSSATTAQGLTLTGSSQFSYNDFFGLEITSTGAVMLNNITANGNESADGVNVDNSCGCSSSGVTFTGTNTFLENWEDGLEVYSFGAVALSNVTADDNGVSTVTGYGLYIDNQGAATVQKVTLSGVNSISNNRDTNLLVATKGAIAISSLTASGSIAGIGMDLNNILGLTDSKQPITLTGTNVANENVNLGLRAWSYGVITINNLSANDNDAGAQLINDGASTPMGITLKGINSFDDNTGIGLEILSDGAVLANSVSAVSNGVYGVKVGYPGGPSASAVTFTGVNSLNENGEGGLYINTFGAIALSNVSANDNLVNHGIELGNTASTTATPKNVTLSGVNSANNNTVDGVRLYTYGDVVVNSLTASGNGVGAVSGMGAYINNSTGTTMKKVTFTGSNVFDDNLQDGLSVTSLGAITANNLSASGNDLNGVVLDNLLGTAHAGITLTGANNFSDNVSAGLQALSEGPIAASNLTASGNMNAAFPAIDLSNSFSDNAQKVTVSGLSVINANQGGGLRISSKGAVSVNSLTATANLFGLNIDNTLGPAGSPQAVMLTGTNVVSGATSYGVEVDSYGPISVANLSSSGNVGFGADLSNLSSTLPQTVALTGANVFSNNTGLGLNVSTNSAITSATSLTGSNNSGGSGINLNNGGGTGEINLKGNNVANNNYQWGFALSSGGAITMNNVTAKDNGITGYLAGSGVSAVNAGAIPVKDVKLTGTNVLTGNYDANLYIESAGAISINSVTANGSVIGQGTDLTNTATEGKAVTITGTNYFNDNFLEGLEIDSRGVITTNNISANRNGDAAEDGAFISNDTATTPRAVTMNGTNVFIDNLGQGLHVLSDGAVTVSNLHAHYNADDGIYVQNNTGTPAVTLSGLNYFRHNLDNGVEIYSNGAVTVNKTTAEDNNNDGLFVDNATGNITLMCGSFTNNTGNGVDIDTNAPGIKKLVGIFAAGNGATQISNNGSGALVTVRTCP